MTSCMDRGLLLQFVGAVIFLVGLVFFSLWFLREDSPDYSLFYLVETVGAVLFGLGGILRES